MKPYPRGFDPKTGTIVIGMISWVLSVYYLTKNLCNLGTFESVYRSDNYQSLLGIFVESKVCPMADDGRFYNCKTEYGHYFAFLIPHILTYGIGVWGYIGFPIIYAVLSGIMLQGAISKKTNLLLPWLCLAILSVFANIAILFLATYNYGPSSIFVNVTSNLMIYGLEVYFIMIVYSYHALLQQGGLPTTKSTANRIRPKSILKETANRALL